MKRQVLFLMVTMLMLVVDGLLWVRSRQVPMAVPLTRQKVVRSNSLDQRCRRTVGADGFGTVRLTGTTNLDKQTVKITVNCRWQLLPGARLNITKSHLLVEKLLITSSLGPGQATWMQLANSDLKGQGLQVQLKAAASQVQIKDSRFSFPLSIGVSVGAGDSDQQARLHVKNSTLVSSGASSRGIVLASTGEGHFQNNHFGLRSGDQAIMLAVDCQASQNVGQILACMGT
jgi:hypothetical protein